jgi:hypothetical protein
MQTIYLCLESVPPAGPHWCGWLAVTASSKTIWTARDTAPIQAALDGLLHLIDNAG